jgi:hypothetical protein
MDPILARACVGRHRPGRDRVEAGDPVTVRDPDRNRILIVEEPADR